MKIELTEDQILTACKESFMDDIDFMVKVVDICTHYYNSQTELIGRLYESLPDYEQENVRNLFIKEP
jgi:hypothetical protein